MAVQKYFYKDPLTNLFNLDGNIIPPGNYNLEFHTNDTVVSLRDFTDNKLLLHPIEITNILKEGGIPYIDKDDLIIGVSGFF